MGLTRQLARVILQEHRFRPITGRVLFIGRQTIFLTPVELCQLLDEEMIPRRPEARLNLDVKTSHGANRGYVTDESFIQSFAAAYCDAIDVSDYEGATIIANLNEELPMHLKGQFDFIFNGSCLDNIFDGANAMRRINELLSPTGRVVHFERCSYYPGVYLAYPPEWFYDYYAANKFADCHAYYVLRPGSGGIIVNDESWELFRYFPDMHLLPRYENQVTPWGTPLNLHSLVLAERQPTSTTSVFPIQVYYRTNEEKQALPIPFSNSPRPGFGVPSPQSIRAHWHHAGFIHG